MKVEIKENGKVKERDFPKLMKANDGSLVLFKSQYKGTLIYTPRESSFYKLGTFREDWIIENFTDFEGSITLSND